MRVAGAGRLERHFAPGRNRPRERQRNGPYLQRPGTVAETPPCGGGFGRPVVPVLDGGVAGGRVKTPATPPRPTDQYGVADGVSGRESAGMSVFANRCGGPSSKGPFAGRSRSRTIRVRCLRWRSPAGSGRPAPEARPWRGGASGRGCAPRPPPGRCRPIPPKDPRPGSRNRFAGTMQARVGGARIQGQLNVRTGKVA